MGSKVPTPEEIVILSGPLLRVAVRLGKELKDLQAKWALGGDAAEIMKGVNTQADHLEVVTTKEGTDEICRTLSEYVTLQPAVAEKRLPRDADINGDMLPVYVKSAYAELTIDGVRVEVYGDLQFKVAEWEWGDPLDYEPETVNVVGTTVPTVPLGLKSELDLGLGWLDRVVLITDAIMRGQHRH